MKKSLNKLLSITFCLIWIVILFLDYWHYHPSYAFSLTHFRYWDTIFIFFLIGAATFFGISRFHHHNISRFLLNGIGVFVLFLLLSGIIIWSHHFKILEKSIDATRGLVYLGKIVLSTSASYFIFMTCYALGALFFKKLFSSFFDKGENIVLKLALGITLITVLLMLLGFFQLLKLYFILPIFLLILGLGWRQVLEFIQVTLFQKIGKLERLGWVGFSSFFTLLIFISLNFLSNVRPMPFGFDALAIYLNVPNLIGQYEGLVEGYSPYYWSLFVSLGHIIFDKTEVVISLSVFGGILSLFAMYEIGRKWLSKDYTLLMILIFYSFPLVNYQSYRDIKTDLGLLFILLTLLIVFIRWLSLLDTSFSSVSIKETADKKSKPRLKPKSVKKVTKSVTKVIEKEDTNSDSNGLLANYISEPTQLIVLLGILSGMALGVKLTGLIAIFSTLGAFAYVFTGKKGFLISFILIFFIVLVGGLDTSLRPYHLGTSYLMWGSLMIGLAGLVYLGIKQREELIKLIRYAFIYVLFTGLVYMPWPIKNYQETGKISVKTITEGSKVGIPKKFK